MELPPADRARFEKLLLAIRATCVSVGFED